MTDPTHELAMSRWFAAPPEVVFRAFSDPEQLAQWMGPLMFTVPLNTVDGDARSGGHWRMTMVGKDDPTQRSPIDMSLTEVVENELIVGHETAVRLAPPGRRHPDGAVPGVHPRTGRHPARAASGPRLRRDERDGRDRLDAGVPQARRPAGHPAKYRNRPDTHEGEAP